jgi:peptidoglycan hydrolase-like protein with peptidoglycan-binding domain
VLLAPLLSEAQFARSLKLGASGDDVLALQRFLNKNSQTQIASEGPGSPGQETGFFGAKTRDAVMRFQDQYRSEILVPAGVTSPTGIAGARTLAKIVSLQGGVTAGSLQTQIPAASVPALPTLSSVPTSPFSFAKAPVNAFGLGKSIVAPGERFVVYGSGFDNEMVVFSAGGNALDVISRRPESVDLSVPQGTKEGSYEIVMTDQRTGALIENSGRRLPLTVVTTPASPPSVSSIEPSTIPSAGGNLTIRGTGFRGEVYVLTPFGPLKARVVADNEISANLADAPYFKDVVSRSFASVPAAAMPKWNIPLMVATDVGLSEQSQVTITR